MRRAWLRLAAAAALVLVAVLLAVVARDVLSWRGQTDRAAVGIAASSPNLGIWEPSTWLPTGISRSLLGAADDVELGRALQRFQLVRSGAGGAYRNRLAVAAQAELDLDRLGATADHASARSRARMLHAILLYAQLRDQGGDPLTPLLRVTEELQKAVRTDPANAAAKYDLEALLNVVKPLQAAFAPGELPEKGAPKGSRVGGGGSGGSISGGGGF